MKTKVLVLTCLITIIAAASVSAVAQKSTGKQKLPSAAAVLKKYVKAIGGKSAHKKLKSRLVVGTIEMPAIGLKGSFETTTAVEGKSFTKTNLSGVGEILEGTDGSSAWARNPMQGDRDKTGLELAQSKIINAFNREIKLETFYPKIEVMGIEKVGANDTYVLKASTNDGLSETWFFDVNTGHLKRTDMTIVSPEGNLPTSTLYLEMLTRDGVVIPSKMHSKISGIEMVMVVTEIKHNLPVSDALFAKPK